MTSLKTVSRAVVWDEAPGRHGSVPDGGEDALDGAGSAQAIGALGREVEERQQRLLIPHQALDGLGMLRLVPLGEHRDGGAGRGPARRTADLARAAALMPGCTERGTVSRTMAALCCQQLW